MKHGFLLIMTGLILLVLAGEAVSGDGIVSLYSVNGSTTATTVRAGWPVRFLIKYTNDLGIKCDVSTGFRIQSPDGVSWDSTTIDSITPFVNGEAAFSTYFNVVAAYLKYSAEGDSPDTVGFLGSGWPTKPLRQLPVGFNDTVFAVTAWLTGQPTTGKHICIDSSFYQPGGTWLWVDRDLVDHYPSFAGMFPGQQYTPGLGFCFQFVEAGFPANHVAHVPGDYATIQGAIDASSDGDTILVMPGTYTENISFHGKRIVVQGSQGAEVTTLRPADPNQHIVSFMFEPRGARLSSFTLTGGKAGAIYCYASSATITGNIVTRNGSTDLNTGTALTATGCDWFLVQNNRFTLDSSSAASTIAVWPAQLGALTPNGTICYNLFYGNRGQAEIAVGGDTINLRIFNNTLANPSLFGIALNAPGSVDVRNNIITGATMAGVAGVSGSGMYLCEYNCTFGNYSDYWDVDTGMGNIFVDPLYANPGIKNYRLSAASPCINAGDPDPQFNDPDGTRNDMGAFYNYSGPQPTADTLHVPSDRPTIQQAINDVNPHGLVLVSPGTYYENINFNGKALRLVGVRGRDSTFIRSPLVRRPVLPDVIIDTVTSGLSGDYYRAMFAAASGTPVVTLTAGSDSTTLIRGFTIDGGNAVQGISCLQSNPVIRDCIIQNGAGYWDGGGLWIQKCRPTILNNIIRNNTTPVTGGGIFLHLKDSSGIALISQNEFRDNVALNGAGIGIIYGRGARVTRNLLVNNDCPSNSTRGGALYTGVTDSVFFISNTVVDCSFGITLLTTQRSDARNNLVARCSMNAFEQRFDVGPNSGTTFDYNLIWAQSGTNYYNSGSGPHDLNIDPMIGSDMHLLPTSPCVNAGDPNPVYNDPDGTRNDIGAFPLVGGGGQPADTLRVPADRATIQAAINDVSSGGVVLVSPGTYTGGLLISGKSVRIVSTDGPDVTTIMAGSNVDLVVFIGPEATPSLLEGFTLLGGHIGIWCQSSGPTIRRNILAYQHVDDWAAISIGGPGYPGATLGPAPAVIVNNTIVYSANGGISTFSTVAPIIRNNIIAFTGHYGVHKQTTGLPLIADYNDIFGNPEPYYNWPDSTIGNIQVDPLLDQQYHLQAGSPCINAGNPSAMYNDPDGTRNDIGAVPYGGGGSSDPIPTNEWIILFCANGFLDGSPLPTGGVLTAYDPQGVLCGKIIVGANGAFGPLLVYADDAYTQRDEGASPGDVISFKLNGHSIVPSSPVIWTQNGAVTAVCSFVTGTCLRIPIHRGWNLISWNVAYDAPIETFLAGVRGSIDIVLGFDRGGLVYLPSLPAFSTLTTVDHQHGYWIKANRDTVISVCGRPLGCSDAIPIYGGWNLVGYMPQTAYPIETALWSLTGDMQVVLGYDQGGRVYVPDKPQFNTLTTLMPGFGYWIRAIGNNTLLPVDCIDLAAKPSTEPTQTGIGSRYWMSVYGESLTLDGAPLPEGSTISFVTENDVTVGSSTYASGILKFTPLYGFDEQDESTSQFAKSGDRLWVAVNGVKTGSGVTWEGNATVQRLTALTGMGGGNLPKVFSLGQNYPNPFNPQTTIEFALPVPCRVRVVVYNLLGQSVKTLADGEYIAGNHRLVWDGTDGAGNSVSSGLYLYRIDASQYHASKKMVLLK